jgi:hypothetical protein
MGMAVSRTILPRKGFIQPQHGLTGYEADQDANWLLLDTKVAFISDLPLPQSADLGINGVVSGFALSPSTSLIPMLSPGVLYAQGNRYAPGSAPAPPAAPANAATYLFYNSAGTFYYEPSAVGASAGDALIGQVITTVSTVNAVIQATRIFGQVAVSATAAGNFTVPHILGRAPVGAVVQMTSAGAIWFQAGLYDATNLYLTGSASGVTARVQVW